MSAILVACAVSGFYVAVGHCYYVKAPDMTTCQIERARIASAIAVMPTTRKTRL